MRKSIQTVFFYLSLVFSVCMLVACATNPQGPELSVELQEFIEAENPDPVFPRLDNELFGEPVAIPSRDEVLALDEEQKKDFLAYLRKPSTITYASYQYVYRYLENLSKEFTYADATLDAATTLSEKRGNCMSLAMLTAALANFHEVEIRYQLVNRLPVFQEYEDIVFNAKHIRSILYPRGMEEMQYHNLFQSRAVVDYYPSRFNYVSQNIDEDGLMGHYYRNLSAEAMGKGDNRLSYYLLLKSLEHQPEHQDAINSLAVLHRRIGAFDKAEELYRYGIKHATRRLTLLKNYRAFLQIQNRTEEAGLIEEELKKYNDPDPFPWMHSANEAYEEKDYRLALEQYQKAISLAPYLHQAHFGKAKALYMLGQLSDSEMALKRALAEAYDIKSKSLYETKLAALSNERFN